MGCLLSHWPGNTEQVMQPRNRTSNTIKVESTRMGNNILPSYSFFSSPFPDCMALSSPANSLHLPSHYPSTSLPCQFISPSPTLHFSPSILLPLLFHKLPYPPSTLSISPPSSSHSPSPFLTLYSPPPSDLNWFPSTLLQPSSNFPCGRGLAQE